MTGDMSIPIEQEIYWLAEAPEEIETLEEGDIWSLRARLEDMPDPTLDALWRAVLVRTGSGG
jgi:hypothetical protein